MSYHSNWEEPIKDNIEPIKVNVAPKIIHTQLMKSAQCQELLKKFVSINPNYSKCKQCALEEVMFKICIS